MPPVPAEHDAGAALVRGEGGRGGERLHSLPLSSAKPPPLLSAAPSDPARRGQRLCLGPAGARRDERARGRWRLLCQGHPVRPEHLQGQGACGVKGGWGGAGASLSVAHLHAPFNTPAHQIHRSSGVIGRRTWPSCSCWTCPLPSSRCCGPCASGAAATCSWGSRWGGCFVREGRGAV